MYHRESVQWPGLLFRNIIGIVKKAMHTRCQQRQQKLVRDAPGRGRSMIEVQRLEGRESICE